MSTTDRPTTEHQAAGLARRPATYASQVPLTMLAAFVLSAVHTVHSSAVGIADPGWETRDPGVWLFYAVGFAMTGLARSAARWAQALVLTFLVTLLVIAMLVYPTMFGPQQQTTFGWIENDIYVGLLAVATYLSVLRLARVAIAIDRRARAAD